MYFLKKITKKEKKKRLRKILTMSIFRGTFPEMFKFQKDLLKGERKKGEEVGLVDIDLFIKWDLLFLL